MKLKTNWMVAALVLLVSSNSCIEDDDASVPEEQTAGQYDAAVIVEWYDLIKTLTMQTEGYTPPVAARAFGYTGIALYEGLVHGMPTKTSLSGKLNGLQMNSVPKNVRLYHWPTVANTVLATMTRHFYSNASNEGLMTISRLEEKHGNKFLKENGSDIYETSVLFADEVAEIIIEWSSTDGGNDGQFRNFPSGYNPPVGPGFWLPTAPHRLPALQPYWGSNRPFLTSNVEDTQPMPPPPFSSEPTSLCYQRALEVYNVVTNITPEQKKIAEFWSDDPTTTATPPGHSISILNQLIKENNLSLDLAAVAFVKLGIAISDAFVACWKTKYETGYMRPITYINTYIDPSWTPILITPPFPEFTSGHSVQSGALAEILTKQFGENYNFTDRTHESRKDIDGTPRRFNNFYQLAEEAAISRLYGGIHFQEAISLGLEQGYQIGRNVNALKLDK